MNTPKKMRLGVAGLGTVGGALVRQLTDDKAQIAQRAQCEIELVAVSARKPREVGAAAFIDDPLALAARDDIDCVVELIGGETVAYQLVEAALKNGKHVITANKALLAHHGMALASLAEAQGVALNYEAAIAASVPVVKTLRESLAGERIDEVSGILNGTCNYILCEMEKTGRSFDVILAEAQHRGYAEADPSFDIEGEDAAHKLSLLASLAFGCGLLPVATQGISDIGVLDIQLARDMGYRIRLIASACRRGGEIECSVRPALVLGSGRLARVEGTRNAVRLESTAGRLLLEGEGAGARPTASAVCADIIDVARGRILPVFGVWVDDLTVQGSLSQTGSSAFYLRLFARDRAGSMAAIMSAMAAADISLAGVHQPAPEGEGANDQEQAAAAAPVALMTHKVSQGHIDNALDRLAQLEEVAAKPLAMRIEE